MTIHTKCDNRNLKNVTNNAIDYTKHAVKKIKNKRFDKIVNLAPESKETPTFK